MARKTRKRRPKILACVFDAYGTLFDVHSAAARCRGDLGDKADALSDAWRQKQLQYTWLRSLMGAYVDFWQVTGDGLDYAMESVGIHDNAIRAKLLDLYLQLDAYPEVPAVLDRLKSARLTTAILSNGTPEMLDAAVRSAGLEKRLKHVLSVDEIGVYKPDPKVYQLAVDRVGALPREICFMSSNAWDACGAAHFGFQVVWVNRFDQPPERLPGKLKDEIWDLDALPAILGID